MLWDISIKRCADACWQRKNRREKKKKLSITCTMYYKLCLCPIRRRGTSHRVARRTVESKHSSSNIKALISYYAGHARLRRKSIIRKGQSPCERTSERTGTQPYPFGLRYTFQSTKRYVCRSSIDIFIYTRLLLRWKRKRKKNWGNTKRCRLSGP